jgi:hypothetical protein
MKHLDQWKRKKIKIDVIEADFRKRQQWRWFCLQGGKWTRHRGLLYPAIFRRNWRVAPRFVVLLKVDRGCWHVRRCSVLPLGKNNKLRDAHLQITGRKSQTCPKHGHDVTWRDCLGAKPEALHEHAHYDELRETGSCAPLWGNPWIRLPCFNCSCAFTNIFVMLFEGPANTIVTCLAFRLQYEFN